MTVPVSGDPPVSYAEILDGLREWYGVDAREFERLGGGLDEAAWTYRVSDGSGWDLVVRLQRGEPREAAHRVPRRLHEMGAEAVVAPIRTTDHQLYLRLCGLTWTLYPFISGVDGYHRDMTDQDWYTLGAAIRVMHDIAPPDGVVPTEDFDVTKYDALTEWEAVVQRSTRNSGAYKEFADTWNRHIATITAMLEQMRRLAALRRRRPAEQVICHGDLHLGNVLIDRKRVHIIDWDEVRLVPRERDFIFVPHDPGPRASLSTVFLSGYGISPTEIDWVALTYFRTERVIQDAVVEVTKAFGEVGADVREAAGWLRHFFADDGEAAAAQAACHLRTAPS